MVSFVTLSIIAKCALLCHSVWKKPPEKQRTGWGQFFTCAWWKATQVYVCL